MDLLKKRGILESLKGSRKALQDQRTQAQQRQQWLSQAIIDSEEAQLIIQLVAKKTQKQLSYRIEEPVSISLNSVFDDPYSMKMDFPVKYERTHCKFVFTKGKIEGEDLLFMGGGGAVDVAAFGLQTAILILMKGTARPILLLDEPLKNLKGSHLPRRGAEMIKEISDQLSIQVIMVSHIPEQKAGADRLIEVFLQNRESGVQIQDRR